MCEMKMTTPNTPRLSHESHVVVFLHSNSIIDNATTTAAGRYGHFLCIYSTQLS